MGRCLRRALDPEQARARTAPTAGQPGAGMARAERRGKDRLAIPRIAEPDEISPAVVYFASDLSGYATGSELLVDGGSGHRLADPFRVS